MKGLDIRQTKNRISLEVSLRRRYTDAKGGDSHGWTCSFSQLLLFYFVEKLSSIGKRGHRLRINHVGGGREGVTIFLSTPTPHRFRYHYSENTSRLGSNSDS